MITVHPSYLIDEKNQKTAVVLPYSEWEQLLEDIEELDDIRAYDRAKAQPSDILPFEDAIRQIQTGNSV